MRLMNSKAEKVKTGIFPIFRYFYGTPLNFTEHFVSADTTTDMQKIHIDIFIKKLTNKGSNFALKIRHNEYNFGCFLHRQFLIFFFFLYGKSFIVLLISKFQ